MAKDLRPFCDKLCQFQNFGRCMRSDEGLALNNDNLPCGFGTDTDPYGDPLDDHGHLGNTPGENLPYAYW